MEWITWVVLGVLLVLVFVLPLFTRKKQQTQVNQMLSSVEVGDKIKTVGGVIGIVIKVEQISPVDKEFVVETGDTNKSQLRFDINAIYQIITKANAPIAPVSESENAPVVKGTEEMSNYDETVENISDNYETVKSDKPEATEKKTSAKTKTAAKKEVHEEVLSGGDVSLGDEISPDGTKSSAKR